MHTMHLLPSVAIQPNLELKTRLKLLLGSLLLVIAFPAYPQWMVTLLVLMFQPSDLTIVSAKWGLANWLSDKWSSAYFAK